MNRGNKVYIHYFQYWGLGIFLVSLVCGLNYLITQQVLRQDANDPQIQMAEDAAIAIEGGGRANINNLSTIDISKSLSPYLAVYDKNGSMVSATGILDNKPLFIPKGIFEYLKNREEDRVTWQPKPGVRQAIVVRKIEGQNPGFVMAGRSLREVEKREERLLLAVASVWVTSVALILIFPLLINLFIDKSPISE